MNVKHSNKKMLCVCKVRVGALLQIYLVSSGRIMVATGMRAFAITPVSPLPYARIIRNGAKGAAARFQMSSNDCDKKWGL